MPPVARWGVRWRCLIAAVKIVGCSGVGHRPDRDIFLALFLSILVLLQNIPRVFYSLDPCQRLLLREVLILICFGPQLSAFVSVGGSSVQQPVVVGNGLIHGLDRFLPLVNAAWVQT